ncbi:MAG: hypothetical protein RSC29_04655, partial [Oscillospiraceae bacterium]
LSDKSAKQYLGQSVDFYVHEDVASGKEVIMTMTPTSKNVIYDIKTKDISLVEDTKVEYFVNDEARATKSVRYDSETLFVKNNALVTDWNKDSLSNLKRGSIKFIDNDNDGTIEVILAKEYTSAIVESVNLNNGIVYFKDGFTLYDKKYFEFAPENNELYVTVCDLEGNPVEIKDIKTGDIFSAFENSADDTRMEVIISHNVVTDKIMQINREDIKIGEEIYGLETENALNGFSVGDLVKVYINFNNEIVYTEKEVIRDQYGYVLNVVKLDNLSGDAAIRIVLPETLAEKYDEEENESGGASTKVAKIACKNNSVQIFNTVEKLNIAGEKISGADKISAKILNKVVAFSTNSDGEINRIVFPTEVGKTVAGDGDVTAGPDRIYNSYEKTFGKTTEEAFGVTEKTLTICLPKNDSSTESGKEFKPNPSATNDDYLVNVEMNNGQGYTVKGFEKNADTYTADLIVVQAIMKAGNLTTPTIKSKVGFVTDISVALNENAEEVQKVDMLTDNTTKSYMVASTLKDSTGFRKIKQGELIAYSLDGNDDLDGYKSLSNDESLGGEIFLGMKNGYKENETYGGYLVDARYNLVSKDLNRWVSELDCGTEVDGVSERTYRVTKSNSPPIFLYNTRNQTAQFADVKEIRAGIDKIFVSAANDTVRAIVVIR